MSEQSSIKVVDLSGSYYEQGYRHGRALADVIHRVMGEYLGNTPPRDERIWRYLARLRQNTARYAAPLLDEFQGIVAGSGLDEEELWAWNCLGDIWQLNTFCSTVSFRDTPEGPLIGKTNDIGPNRQHHHVLLRRTEGEGRPMLWATYPGTISANCFVNGAGVAYGGASGFRHVRNEEGMPSNVLLRWLGEVAGSVAEGVDALRRIPIMHHPANLTLADEGGRLAIVEKCPDGFGLREPDLDGVAFATNHFCTPALSWRDDATPEWQANSRARFANLYALTRGGEHSLERMKEILADHHQPGAICQHRTDDLATAVAYVAAPRSRTIYLAYGRPCEVPFVAYGLRSE